MSRRASDLLAELEPGTLQSPAWRDLEKRAAAKAEAAPLRRWRRPELAWAATVLLAFGIGWLSRAYWVTQSLSPVVTSAEREQPRPAADRGASRDGDRMSARERPEGIASVAQPSPRDEVSFAEEPERREQLERSATEKAEGGEEVGEPRPALEAPAPPAETESEALPVRQIEPPSAADRSMQAAGLRRLAESALEDTAAVGEARSRSAMAASPERVLLVQPEAAAVWLGGELRTLPDLRLQRIEVLPGAEVEGGVAGRTAVRLLYTDAAGSELTLVQQRLGDRADVERGPGPALVVEPGGRKTYRWHDEDGYLLMLQGEVSSDSLRALAERVE